MGGWRPAAASMVSQAVGRRERAVARHLQGHTSAVRGVALSADGRLLASGSYDGTVKLWEAPSGTCLRTLRGDRRYERLDITGLTGVTEAQRTALLMLGAVEHERIDDAQSAPAGTRTSTTTASAPVPASSPDANADSRRRASERSRRPTCPRPAPPSSAAPRTWRPWRRPWTPQRVPAPACSP